MYKKYPITYTLIAICVIMYIVSIFLFGFSMDAVESLYLGAYNYISVRYLHQFYRLITANFVHFGIVHILCNCMALNNIGPFIEANFKKHEYILFIVVSMLGTNLIPFVFTLITDNNLYTVSGGISGVIFGMLGAIVMFKLRYKYYYDAVFKAILPNLLLMIGLSVMVPSISLGGHLGGLIGGMMATDLIIANRRSK